MVILRARTTQRVNGPPVGWSQCAYRHALRDPATYQHVGAVMNAWWRLTGDDSTEAGLTRGRDLPTEFRRAGASAAQPGAGWACTRPAIRHPRGRKERNRPAGTGRTRRDTGENSIIVTP